MKYKTIIELVCEASDTEEASFTAGEYLCGRIDAGVLMKCRTVGLVRQVVVKCGMGVVFTIFIASLIAFNTEVTTGSAKESVTASLRLPGTCTVQPILKTSTGSALQKEWEKNKLDFVLDCLKD